MRYALILALLAACSDDPVPYTWGDVSLSLSTAYCNAVVDRCHRHVDVPVCIRHSYSHFCELDVTCDTALEDELGARAAVDSCASAFAWLDPEGCFLLTAWGVAPEKCGPALDYKPDPADAGPSD